MNARAGVDGAGDGADRSSARPVSKITHDIVNTAMALDLRLGVLESSDSSMAIGGLRRVTDELLSLVRELEATSTSEPPR